MKHYLGIDLGGTVIKTAVVNEQYKIVATAERRTALPRSWEEVLDDCLSTALMAVSNANLSIEDFPYIGIGSPGIIDVESGIIETAANLGFLGVPLKEYFEKKINIPVLIENDANAAAYGEFIAGAGQETEKSSCIQDKPYTDLVSITIGTGIGSGIILDGKIFRGSNGLAGELGHTVIDLDGRPCACGRKGCMDMYASSRGLKQTTCEFMEKYPDSLLWQEAGGSFDGVSGRTAFRAADKGDEIAKKTLERYIASLGAGVVNAISIFQPQIITIAGGISKEGEKLLVPLRAIAEKECLRGPNTILPLICCGKLQDKAGVIGAAILGI